MYKIFLRESRHLLLDDMPCNYVVCLIEGRSFIAPTISYQTNHGHIFVRFSDPLQHWLEIKNLDPFKNYFPEIKSIKP